MLWTIKEWLARPRPKTNFLIRPIIPRNGITVVHGPQTAGKTQLMFTQALAVLSQSKFLSEPFPVERHGPVIFFEFDLPDSVWDEKLEVLESVFNDLPIKFYHQYLQVHTPDWAEKAPDFVKEAQDMEPALVCIDSLRRAHRLDEDHSGGPSIVYDAWRRLFPDSAIQFLHHDKKKQSGPFSGDPDESGRGAGGWINEADAVIHLVKERKEGVKGAKMRFVKCYKQDLDPISLKFNEYGLLEVREPTLLDLSVSFIMEHPDADNTIIANYLQALKTGNGKAKCGRTKAFEVVRQARTVRTQTDSQVKQ